MRSASLFVDPAEHPMGLFSPTPLVAKGPDRESRGQ